MAKTKDPAAAGPAHRPPPTTSTLIISRNKHWRFISAFHGPWLHLPHELLESLAHQNFHSPRPHPIHPAVLYDLANIRKAVDEAANLAVRAASGLSSANAKLSRERKHRMRDLATQKLSHAYHLDEIAASVAAMQSTSTLDDVAHMVLQRTAAHHDAKYVHFFHEKIPSRMMAEYTHLDPLNDIIAERPCDGSPLRTRALTRMFKKDYLGAVRDLTDGLAVARYMQQQHISGNHSLVLAQTTREEANARDKPVKEEDQPSSLEMQLLFHRADVYFSLACQHVHEALHGPRDIEGQPKVQHGALHPGTESHAILPEDKEAHRNRLESRKLVKTYARRALKDYVAFLSHFDYTPGLDSAVVEDFFRKVNNEIRSSISSHMEQVQKLTHSSSEVNGQRRRNEPSGTWSLPPSQIYQVSALFSNIPPPNLPPYPPSHAPNPAIIAFAETREAVTYHPLLTDALHSLLLCHGLLQTPPTELRRHSLNVARLARLCDGHPVFHAAPAAAARSPAHADWLEVLRRVGNDWIEITGPWEQLCSRSPISIAGALMKQQQQQQQQQQRKEKTEAQCREHEARHKALLAALADGEVVDDESFQHALRANEERCHDRQSEGVTVPHACNSCSTDGKKDYCYPSPISTTRAEAVARWVCEAPLSGGGGGGGAKRRRAGGRGKKKGGVVRLEESGCQGRQGEVL